MTTELHTNAGADQLLVRDLVVSRAGQQVLHGVSLQVQAGHTVAVLGPNGAGKTTLLRTISGLHRPRSGEIRLGAGSIAKAKPRTIVAAGLAHVPEGREVFPRMTVEENLVMGGYTSPRASLRSALGGVYSLFPVLRERRGQRAGLLSGGEQQMLAIGRALIGRPRALMLDEPSMGLAPKVVADVGEAIRTIAASGTTILIVEQQVRLALQLADYVYVLVNGRIATHGPVERFSSDTELARAYLGVQLATPDGRGRTSESSA